MSAPFYATAQFAALEAVLLFTNREKFDVNTRDKAGAAALDLIVHRGRPEIVRSILGSRAIDGNVETDDGMTPMHIAACEQRADIVRLLCDAPSIHLNQRGEHGRTPLHCAAHENDAMTVQALLEMEGIQVTLMDTRSVLFDVRKFPRTAQLTGLLLR
jgi:ankyrin repeat protein